MNKLMNIAQCMCCVLLASLMMGCAAKPVQQAAFPELAALRDSIEHKVYKKVKAAVVYQGGEVLVEEYYNGMSSNDIHDARSVGKSFASALLGISIDEGHISSLDLPISDFYDLKDYKNYSEEKGQIKLRHLATMSSNFFGNDDDMDTPGNEEHMYDKPNWVQWTLNLPLDQARNTGESWQYFTAGVVVLGDIMNQRLPNGLEQFSKEKLFDPIENTNYRWAFTPQRVPSTAGNFRTTARGFADFGQLYLNGGTWKGKRVISKEWVAKSLTKQIETSSGSRDYGYLWWIKDVKVGDSTYRTTFCSGNGGNKIFLIQDLDAVVVILASAYGQRYGHTQADEILTEFLLPIAERKAGK